MHSMAQSKFHARALLGSVGSMVQHHKLLYSRVAVHEPTLILVQRGRKKLRWAGRELPVETGETVALAGGRLSMYSTNRMQMDSIKRNGLRLTNA